MQAEAALELLGSYGRYQLIFFVILSAGMMFPAGWHTLAYLFQAYTPRHHCMVKNGSSLNQTIPWNDDTDFYSSCLVYVNNSNATQQCSEYTNQWVYYNGYDETDTIVVEWDLVCQKDALKKTTNMATALGVVVGSMLFTPMIDMFGRKSMFLACSWVMVLIGVWNAFVYHYPVYLAVRFLVGVVRSGYDLAAYVLACELFPAAQRTFAGIIIEDFWGLAICSLAAFMYLIPNWRHLQLLFSLLGLLTVPLYWFLPESIPWLVSRGRLKEAEETIQRAAKINRIEKFPQNIFTSDANPPNKTLDPEEEPDLPLRDRCLPCCYGKPTHQAYTLLDVVKHARLRWFLAATSMLWFISVVVYYGMTLNTEQLAGNRFLNLFISGLVEIPAFTLAFFIIQRFGRKRTLIVLHFLAGIFLIISEFIPRKTGGGSDLTWIKVTLVMLGKFCITDTFAIAYLYTPELFPTTVRSQAMGVAVMVGRSGGMLAPFSSSLNDIRPWLTSVVFGAVSIFGGLLALTLPETNKRPLPQTIEDIESWYPSTSSESVSSASGVAQPFDDVKIRGGQPADDVKVSAVEKGKAGFSKDTIGTSGEKILNLEITKF